MRARHLLPLVASAAVVLAPSAAQAASGAAVQSGWWNEAAVGSVAAPSPGSSSQLQVSNGFSGPLAFAAVRISLPPGTDPATMVTLRLAVPSGSSVGTPAVSACPTTTSWKPGPDQPASAAPGYSCRSGRQADGRVTTGAETWVFPASWGSGATVSVALVPTPGTTTPFSISYTPPAGSSVSFAAGGGTAGGPGGVPSGATPSPGDSSTATSPPASTPSAATVTPPDASAAVAAPPSPADPGGAAQAPALGAIPEAGTSGPAGGSGANGAGTLGTVGGAVAAPASAAPGGGGPAAGARAGRGGRVLAFCLLVATGLALWFVSAQPDRAPRLLGSVGVRRPAPAGDGGLGATARHAPVPPPIRGIGRFARERTAPPNRL